MRVNSHEDTSAPSQSCDDEKEIRFSVRCLLWEDLQGATSLYPGCGERHGGQTRTHFRKLHYRQNKIIMPCFGNDVGRSRHSSFAARMRGRHCRSLAHPRHLLAANVFRCRHASPRRHAGGKGLPKKHKHKGTGNDLYHFVQRSDSILCCNRDRQTAPRNSKFGRLFR
jgi:hypothetical protein